MKSARLCLHDGVGNIYSSYRSNISCLLWQERPVSLPPPPPPLTELDCLVLWCSLATVIVPFPFTIFSMYVRPRLPKTVHDLAEMCYTIHLLLFLLLKVLGFFFFLTIGIAWKNGSLWSLPSRTVFYFFLLLRLAQYCLWASRLPGKCHLTQTTADGQKRCLCKLSHVVMTCLAQWAVGAGM